MAAASPPPAVPPAPGPTTRSPAKSALVSPPASDRVGSIVESGAVRRESVRVLRWSVRGAAKVTGDVDSGDVSVRGGLSVGGKLRADRLDAHGAVEVMGPIDVSGPWRGDGDVRAASTVHAAELSFKGSFRTRGPMTVDRAMDIRGSLSGPSITAGTLRLDGTAEVDGAVQALAMELRLRDSSSFGTLKAKKVRATGRVPNPVDVALHRHFDMKVDRIEAEEVELEGVDVGFVHANRITLGRGAHVTAIEGKVVRRHASARVGPESRSPPPYGLWR